MGGHARHRHVEALLHKLLPGSTGGSGAPAGGHEKSLAHQQTLSFRGKEETDAGETAEKEEARKGGGAAKVVPGKETYSRHNVEVRVKGVQQRRLSLQGGLGQSRCSASIFSEGTDGVEEGSKAKSNGTSIQFHYSYSQVEASGIASALARGSHDELQALHGEGKTESEGSRDGRLSEPIDPGGDVPVLSSKKDGGRRSLRTASSSVPVHLPEHVWDRGDYNEKAGGLCEGGLLSSSQGSISTEGGVKTGGMVQPVHRICSNSSSALQPLLHDV